jgi:predicted dinucleotide-binding enzyme
MKKIGVVGSGAVGETLADGFLKHGYEVMRGSRDPGKLAAWKQKGGAKASTGTALETAKFGEAIVLAVQGSAAEDVVASCGDGLNGKLVIDTCNPIGGAPVNGVLPMFTKGDESLMERLQKKAPQAKFVKAFSSVGNGLMVNPKLASKPSMFICGNDGGAKEQMRAILDQFGWETEDMGVAAAARAIEPLCILWCLPGFLKNDWMHAYKVLRP